MRKLAIVLLCLAGLTACTGQAGSDPTRYLGTWRLQNQEGRYTILSLRNNGTLQIDIRIEGQLSKIVSKSAKAAGTWEIDDTGTRMTLDLADGAAAVGWPGGPNVFTIREVDETFLVLASPDNREHRWEKSSHPSADSAVEAAGPRVTLAPLVVNLTPGSTQTGRRYRWLCAALEVRLSAGSREPDVRSPLRDKVLLLLSSKTYEEVNALDKLERVGDELRALLNPYMDGAVENVVFTRTVVTGNQDAVDAFRSQFES